MPAEKKDFKLSGYNYFKAAGKKIFCAFAAFM
jgi:hypothetical protein